jgi:hypothetical protein
MFLYAYRTNNKFIIVTSRIEDNDIVRSKKINYFLSDNATMHYTFFSLFHQYFL